MKNKIILISIFLIVLCISKPVRSQNAGQAYPVLSGIIIPLQSGTATLINGMATINIEERIANKMQWDETLSYFVMLTPYNDCGQVIISEKNNKGFTISQNCNNQSGSKARCDYVVFLKETPLPFSEK